MIKNIKLLQDSDKELLKSKSAQALPNSPSNRGWSAGQIKSKLYEPQLLLFEWLKTFQEEIIAYLETTELTNANINTFIEKILDGRLVAKKAEQDEQGNNISTTYIKLNKIAKDKASSDLSQLVTIAIVKELLNDSLHQLLNGAPEELDTLNELAEALKNNRDVIKMLQQAIGNKVDRSEFDQIANDLSECAAFAETELFQEEVQE